VALVRASRDPRVRALVTWSAVATFQRYSDADKALWRRRGYIEVENARTKQIFRLGLGLLEDIESHAEAYDPVLAAGRLRIPTLIIHGTRDDAVPAADADRLARAVDPGLGKLMLVEGAGHTFGAAHPFEGTPPALDRVLTATVEWFKGALS
jgi:pimeloyl-ACP methyl ester carboxylesterase